MAQKCTAYIEKEKAIEITASYRDFEGDIERWRDSFYTLWRYQMTWDYAYKIIVSESNSKGVFVQLLVNPAYKDSLIDTMDGLGYRNIITNDTYIGLFNPFDSSMEDIEYIQLDY